jgi:hypothetical protein
MLKVAGFNSIRSHSFPSVPDHLGTEGMERGKRAAQRPLFPFVPAFFS